MKFNVFATIALVTVCSMGCDRPAGKKVEMKPGGYHIMLLNLKRDLEAGQVVNLTLQFRKAGKVHVNAKVR